MTFFLVNGTLFLENLIIACLKEKIRLNSKTCTTIKQN